MSASTPAASKASPRNLRSAVSQRADEAASGRITPTLALVASCVASAPPPPPEVVGSSSPQAATVNARVAATATAPRARNFIWVSPSPDGTADWRLSANSKYLHPNVQVSSHDTTEHERHRTQNFGPLTEFALNDFDVVGR